MKKRLTTLFLLILAFGFVAPLVLLLREARLDIAREIFNRPSFVRALWVTALSGGGGAFLSVLLGAGFARVFAYHEWRSKRWYTLALLIPYLVPNFVLASAYVLAWNPASGLLKPWIPFLGGLYGVPGMMFAFAVSHAPLAYLLLTERWKRIDSALIESSRISGASSWRSLIDIEWPLVRGTAISAMALCFSLNVSAFAIPAWLGAPDRKYTFTFKIYQQLQLGGDDGIAGAAVFSIILMLLVLPAVLISNRISRNEKGGLSGKAARALSQPLEGIQGSAFHFLFWAYQAVSWILPLGGVFISTLVPPGCLQERGRACLSETSLQTYHYVLFELTEVREGAWGSFVYGGISALLILTLSIVVLALIQRNRKWETVFESATQVPYAAPGAVLAIGLIVSASGRYGLNIYNTAWIAVVAFILKYFTLNFQFLKNGLRSIAQVLLEAAQMSGASPTRAWMDVVLPILRPDVLAGFFLVWIPILGELTMSVFLQSPAFKNLGTVLFDLQDYADQVAAGALSIVLVALILLLNQMARWMSRGKVGY